ncbi:MAG: DUF4397 domain-containing protein [Gloeobacteraceae cyanobacterium ES-bin-144]|nr:DUF4397 domain-containing protein [Verrucomicrobiales bacterium]
MKIIFSCFLMLAALLLQARAQENPKLGFVRIVNAIAHGTGNANFLIDGHDLFADGYKPGQTTGGYAVAEGQRMIEVRSGGVIAGKVTVTIATEETLTLVAYTERVPTKNPDDIPKWKIILLKLKQQDNDHGYGLSLVSVANADETMAKVAFPGRGKSQSVSLQRCKPTKLDMGRVRDDVVISVAEKPVTSVSLDAPGVYVVILFENHDGRPLAISFFDPKFAIAG